MGARIKPIIKQMWEKSNFLMKYARKAKNNINITSNTLYAAKYEPMIQVKMIMG